MSDFNELYGLALARKGGERALAKLLTKPKSAAALARIPDDRWLSGMTMRVFQAGFVWRIVEQKWPDFERAFNGFDVAATAYLSDEAIESMLGDSGIIRHHKKLLATRDNAMFLLDLAAEYGTAANYFANFDSARYIDLLDDLKRRANRMGGTSAQYFLRHMGKDSFILSDDVIAALMRERVIDRNPASRRDREAVQAAFNLWRNQSGRSLTEISQVLALGIES